MEVTGLLDGCAVGCAVDGRDGPIGTYAGTRAATAAHEQVYVLVRPSGLWRRTRLVPLEWVRSTTPASGRVTLDATRAEVVGCPPLRADADIRADVVDALSGAGGFFRVPTIRASVAAGVVRLTGHSPHRNAAGQALARVQDVPGVLAVQDHSYEDGALIIAVAQALTHDPGTRAAHLLVTSRLGAIGLDGNVPSDVVKAQATALARAVPGVTQVHNGATVRPAQEAARVAA